MIITESEGLVLSSCLIRYSLDGETKLPDLDHGVDWYYLPGDECTRAVFELPVGVA